MFDTDDMTAKLYVTFVFRRAVKDLALEQPARIGLTEVAEDSGEDDLEPSRARQPGGLLDEQKTENCSEDEDSNEMIFEKKRSNNDLIPLEKVHKPQVGQDRSPVLSKTVEVIKAASQISKTCKSRKYY